MKYIFHCVFIFVGLMSCQKESSTINNVDQKNESLNAQLLDDSTLLCHLKNSIFNEKFIVEDPILSLNHQYDVLATETAVREALESVPQVVLDQWSKIGGKINVSDRFYERCPFSIFACLESGQQGSVHVVVPYLKKNQLEFTPLFQRGILNVIATLHVERLEDFEEGTDENIEEENKYVFGPYLSDVILFLAEISSEIFHKEVIVESGFDIYPLVFTEYFCSKKSRDLLNKDLPEIGLFFSESFQDSLNQLSLNRVSLNSSPRSRSSSGSSDSSISRDSIDRKVELEIGPGSLRSDIQKKHENIDHLNDQIFSTKDAESRRKAILEEISAREGLDASVEILKSYEDLYSQNNQKDNNNDILYVVAEVGLKKSLKIGGFPVFHYTKTKGLENYTGAGRMIYSSSSNVLESAGRLGQKKPITIIVHGTGYGGGNVATDVYQNALSGDHIKSSRGWANPDSSIAKNLKKHYGGDVVSFQWSGNFSDKYRRESGTKLSKEIVSLREKGFEVNLVAHSHGANIVIDALNKTKELSGQENFSTKGEFVSLGRPIRDDYKLSDVKLLSYYVNAFGSRDFVQAIGGELPKRFGKKIDELAQTQIDFGGSVFVHNKLMNAMNNILTHSANDRKEFASEIYSY
ncbi:MAG: hypothetical protein AB8C84_06670 [Oligoflexales bacterium]